MSRLANLDPKKREQYLMIACGVILAVAVIPLGIYLFGSNVSKMNTKIKATQKEIDDLETKRLMSMGFQKRIKQDAINSLPATNEIAAAEYKNWLTGLASRFENAQINNTSTTVEQARTSRRQAGGKQDANVFYTNYKFSLNGKTTLNELGRFLQRFYETETLHLIRSMTIKPIDNAQRVDVTMTIEAISIPQTANKTFEAKKKENDTTEWSRMVAAVTNRNFFSPFVDRGGGGPPPPPPPPVIVSASKYTFLNGITLSNDRPQAWFDFRLEGRQRILKVGERFRIGETNCVLESVDVDENIAEVRVEVRDRETNTLSRTVWSLMVGDTFADAEFERDLDEEEEVAESAM